MIELQHVRVERQGRPILVDVEFEVDRGEFVYLVGPTGAGKSLFLKVIQAILVKVRNAVPRQCRQVNNRRVFGELQRVAKTSVEVLGKEESVAAR